MKLAIVGSRGLTNLVIEPYVTDDVTEIVSGGAKGVDTLVKELASRKGLAFTEILPQYARCGRAAPIKRNHEIVDYADRVLVFWNGSSKGSLSVIKYAQTTNKVCEVILCK